MKRIALIIFLACVCLSGVVPAGGMGQAEDLDREIPLDEPGFIANGDFEGGLTGHSDSGYGIAVPWVPYVSRSLKYTGQAEYEVIRRPLGAIHSGQLAQRWWGMGPWRGGVYQAFSLSPGLYSIEVWYADPAAASLDESKKTSIRVGVYDGVSGYVPPATVRWSPRTTKVGPQWNRIIMSGVPVVGRAATLYIESWNESALPHNVVVDHVEVRALSFFGEPGEPERPGPDRKNNRNPGRDNR